MANFSQDVDGSPTALGTTLAAGEYDVQNRSIFDVHVEEAASAPDADSEAAMVIKPFEVSRQRKRGSEEIYVWTLNDSAAGVAVRKVAA